jgi:hypothetical protein
MDFRLQLQLAEAFGSTNRWYCSQAHGCAIDDAETLLIYYINSGGAEDFAWRYADAMGPKNRWFCSEFYGREITDPQTLWEYYMDHARSNRADNARYESNEAMSELSAAF